MLYESKRKRKHHDDDDNNNNNTSFQMSKIIRLKIFSVRKTAAEYQKTTVWVNREELFSKMGHPRPLFVYFRLFKQTLQFSATTKCEKCPVHGAEIQTHALQNMSILPKPLDRGSCL